MRVIVEQDMEGCAGIVSWARDLKASGELDQALRWMTDEVNAAVDAAFEEGASEVLLLEAHAFDQDRLDPRAKLVKASLFKAQREADALFFVGRHAMAGTIDGVLNHTGSSKSIHEVRINGRPFGELGLCAAWFGAGGVPTAFVTGDEAACREARDFFAKVETVAVKQGVSCHEAISLSHETACSRIREGVRRAMKRLSDFKPFVVEGEVMLEIDFRTEEVADWICRLPWIERTGRVSTRYEAESFDDAYRAYCAQGAMLWRFDA